MTIFIGLKLTETERDALDWLVHTQGFGSRSNALRECFLGMAVSKGLNRGDVEGILAERETHRPRKSAYSPALKRRKKSSSN